MSDEQVKTNPASVNTFLVDRRRVVMCRIPFCVLTTLVSGSKPIAGSGGLPGDVTVLSCEASDRDEGWLWLTLWSSEFDPVGSDEGPPERLFGWKEYAIEGPPDTGRTKPGGTPK